MLEVSCWTALAMIFMLDIDSSLAVVLLSYAVEFVISAKIYRLAVLASAVEVLLTAASYPT